MIPILNSAQGADQDSWLFPTLSPGSTALTDPPGALPMLAGDPTNPRDLAYRPGPLPSGHLQVDPEIHLPSPGMDVEVSYYYNSNAEQSSPMGKGWTHSANLWMEATPSPSLVTFHRGNGAIDTYRYFEDAYGSPPPRGYIPTNLTLKNTLVLDTANNVWRESTPDGREYVYPWSATGLPTSISYASDAVGNRHTFTYQNGLLHTLKDAVGRQVSFAYNSGQLRCIEDWAGRRTTFQYDGNSVPGTSLLTTVIGPSGCQTGYGYDATPRLTRITDPNGYDTTYSYYADGKVQSRTVAGAHTTAFTYTWGQAVITDPLGAVTTQLYANYSYPTHQTSPVGQVVSTAYNSKGEIVQYQDGTGALWTTSYDSREIWPIQKVDPLGNTTTIQRDNYGNITTVIRADNSVWTYLYGYAGSSFDTTGAKRRLQTEVNPLGNRTSYTYTGRGQLASVMDALNNSTNYEYDVWGNLTTVTDALGRTATMAYDAAGNVIQTTDALGGTTRRVYDPQNRVVSLIDALGNTAHYGYDSVGNLKTQIDPLGNITTTVYNVWDKPVKVQDARGYTTQFGYDGVGRLVTVTDALGFTSTTQFDASGRITALINPLGHSTQYFYDAAGRVQVTEDALGYRTTYAYDAAGQVVSVLDIGNDITTTAYDSVGRVIGLQDPNGVWTDTIYDLAGRVQAREDGAGRRTTTIYDAVGRVHATQDALGYRTTYSYNVVGQPTTIINARGFISTTVYDAVGRLQATVDALGYRTTMSYDAAGRTVSVLNARGYISTNVYDAAGRLTASVAPLGWRTTYSYTPTGQIVSVMDALGQIGTNIYDQVDRLKATQTPLGYYTTAIYDAVGQPIAVLDALGRFTTTSYNAVGQVTAVQDPRGYITTMVYKADQLQQIIAPNSGVTSYIYNAVGDMVREFNPLGAFRTWSKNPPLYNLSAVIDPRGTRVTMLYDELDRLEVERFVDGARTTYTYDAIGNLTVANTWYGRVTFSYDARGQITTIIRPVVGRLDYTYDGVGNVTAVKNPDGAVTTYQYDANDKLSRIRPSDLQDIAFIRDRLGRVENEQWITGTKNYREWDRDGNLTQLRIQHSGSSSAPMLARFTGTYDRVGNRLNQVELDGTRTTYTYDATNQLIQERRTSPVAGNSYNITYEYDGLGNRTLMNMDGQITTYSYDKFNQLKQQRNPDATLINYGYDADGNLTSAVPTSGVTTTYAWDVRGKLSSIQFPNGNNESYEYGFEGMRRQKTTNGAVTNFLWNGPNILMEKDDNGSTLAEYHNHSEEMYSPFSMKRGTTNSYFGLDLQDNVRLIVTPSETISDTYDFTAFGQLLLNSGSTVNPFKYGGGWGYYSDTTDRLYIRARYYDPVRGRWTSADPIGFEGRDWNLYRYVANNPIGFSDPEGLRFLPWWEKNFGRYYREYGNCFKDCLKDYACYSYENIMQAVQRYPGLWPTILQGTATAKLYTLYKNVQAAKTALAPALAQQQWLVYMANTAATAAERANYLERVHVATSNVNRLSKALRVARLYLNTAGLAIADVIAMMCTKKCYEGALDFGEVWKGLVNSPYD